MNSFYYRLSFICLVLIRILSAPVQAQVAQPVSGTQLQSFAGNALITTEAVDNQLFSTSQQIRLESRNLDLKLAINQADNPIPAAWDAKLTVEVAAKSSGNTTLKTWTVVLALNQYTAEQVYRLDFTELGDNVENFHILKKSYSSHGSGINALIALSADITDEVRFHIRDKSSTDLSPTSLVAQPCSGCNGNTLSQIRLSWSNHANTFHMPAYDIQIIKLEVDHTGNYEPDWSQASLIAAAPGRTYMDLTLAEGTGYYMWRVRPVGNFYEGGRGNPLNYGSWPTVSTPAGLYSLTNGNYVANPAGGITINPGSSTQNVSGNYFYYRQFDENINWAYNRVFAEDGKQAENITFANGLNQVAQRQTRLHTTGEVLATQQVLDYSGRPVVSTLPAPINSPYLGYKSGFFPLHQSDFDQNPYQVTNPSSLPGTAGGYYSSGNTTGEKAAYVPDAQGVPYSRTLYYNDATGRVLRQSLPGEALSLKNSSDSRNTTYAYAAASVEELDIIFGNEAPDHDKVYKVITTDPNKVSSVQYIGQNGKVLATCLSESPTLLLEIGNEAPITVTESFGPGLSAADGKATVSRKSILVENGVRTYSLNYKIKPATFNLPCGEPAAICQECDYRIEIEISCPLMPDDRNRNIKMILQIDPDDLAGCTTPSDYLELGTHITEASYEEPAGGGASHIPVNGSALTSITLPEGSYIVEKRVYINNTIPTTSQTYLERHLEALKAAASRWSAESNCCGSFTPDLSEYDCSEIPYFCDATDPNDLNAFLSSELDEFASEMLAVIVKEQSYQYGTHSYKNSLGDGGSLAGDFFNGTSGTHLQNLKTELNALLALNTVDCRKIYQCYMSAKSGLEQNLRLWQLAMKALDDPNTGNEHLLEFDPDFDFLMAFYQCLGIDYGLELKVFNPGEIDLNSPTVQNGDPLYTRIIPYASVRYTDPLAPTGNQAYGVQLYGNLYVEQAGNHTFYAYIDDNATLWIDGQEVGKKSYSSSLQLVGSIYLTAGNHKVLIKHTDITDQGVFKLYWYRGSSPAPENSSLISFKNFNPRGSSRECGAYNRVAVYVGSQTPPTVDPDILLVALPSKPSDMPGWSSDETERNRQCIALYFEDLLTYTGTYQILLHGARMSAPEAVRNVCACITDFASQPPGINEDQAIDQSMGLLDETIPICEAACDEKALMFDVAIDTYVAEYNERQGVYTSDNSAWKTYSDPALFGSVSKTCLINTLIEECKEYCQLTNTRSVSEAISELPSNQYHLIPGLIDTEALYTEHDNYKKAITAGALVAPQRTEAYPGSGDFNAFKDDIIEFIYSTWEYGLRYRKHNGVATFLINGVQQPPVSPLPILPNNHTGTNPRGTVQYLQKSKTFKVSGSPEKEFTLVVNIGWSPENDATYAYDDKLRILNFYFINNNQEIFAYFSSGMQNWDGSGSCPSHLKILNLTFDVRSEFNIYFDNSGYLHIEYPNIACTSTYSAQNGFLYSSALHVLRSSDKAWFRFNPLASHPNPVNRPVNETDFFNLYLSDGNREYYLQDKPVFWQNFPGSENQKLIENAKTIIAEINRTGRFRAMLANNFTPEIYVYIPAFSSIQNLENLTLHNESAPILVHTNSFHNHFYTSDFISGSSPSFNRSYDAPFLPLKNLLVSEGSAISASTSDCPYGYELVTNANCQVCLKWTSVPSPENHSDETPIEITCENLSMEYADNLIDHYLAQCHQDKEQQLRSSYQSCIDQLDDAFSLSYQLGYHHYTLYYYDRADNLIKTVPPQGVRQLNPSQTSAVAAYRQNGTGSPVYPAHKMVTEYFYNSLGQLYKQTTPDGGTSQFWYNALGQLVLSQNAEQKDKNNGTYSYSRYDYLGRVVEAGELSGLTPVFNDSEQQIISQLWSNNAFPGNTWSKKDATYTIYSQPQNIDYRGKAQENLRNRVSRTYTASNSTYYSYDPHGNVEWIVQELPEIGRKTVRYVYDLISGSVKEVYFNEETREQFIHKYEYDADNRITTVFTSTDGLLWNKEAAYSYYLHGPLSRAEIGHDKLQGLDYVYTIEGYLKSINQAELISSLDPGRDGTGNGFLKDEFAMELGYYKNDYTRSATSIGAANIYRDPYGNDGPLYSQSGQYSLYNGNISYWMSNSRIGNTGDVTNPMGLKMNVYRYDKLNRLRTADFRKTNASGVWTDPGRQYDESFSYDFNGNITEAERYGYSGYGKQDQDYIIDDLTYLYEGEDNNRLRKLEEAITAPFTSEPDSETDLKVQSDNHNYRYDKIGNLIEDRSEMVTITWNAQGKVSTVTNSKVSPARTLRFEYDASGNRVVKRNIENDKEVRATYYVRDASGNVMAVYEKSFEDAATSYVLREIPIYGSSRIGLYHPNIVVRSHEHYADDQTSGGSASGAELSKLLLPTKGGVRIVDLSSSSAGLSLCENELISGETFSSYELRECNEITVENTLVDENGNLILQGNTIRLKPGFSSILNSRLHARPFTEQNGYTLHGNDALLELSQTEMRNTAIILDEYNEMVFGSFVPASQGKHILVSPDRNNNNMLRSIDMNGLDLTTITSPVNAKPVIVRHPQIRDRFYFIYHPVQSGGGFRKLQYVEVDMNLGYQGANKGAVISSAPAQVSSIDFGFPVVPVEFGDGRSFLYTLRKTSGGFAIYGIKVTENGFEAPVNLSGDISESTDFSPGCDMRISPDGTRLALGLTRMPASNFSNTVPRDIYVWDVNIQTGQLSNQRTFDISSGDIAAIEFSASSDYLFVVQSNGSAAGKLERLDISAPSSPAVSVATFAGYTGYGDVIRTKTGTMLVNQGNPGSGVSSPYGLLEVENPEESTFEINTGVASSPNHAYTINFPRQTLKTEPALEKLTTGTLNNWTIPASPYILNDRVERSGKEEWAYSTNGYTRIQNGFSTLGLSLNKSIATAEDQHGKIIFDYFASAGIKARYGNGTWTPDMAYTQETIIPEINHSWGQSAPYAGISASAFTAEYSGYIYAPSSGNYIFYLTANGVNYYAFSLDGNTHSLTPVSSELVSPTLNLSKGWHSLKLIASYSGNGTKSCQLRWTDPSISKSLIPSTNLSTSPNGHQAYLTGPSGKSLAGASNINVDYKTPAVFIRSPYDLSRFYLITGHEGRIYYHTLSSENGGEIISTNSLLSDNNGAIQYGERWLSPYSLAVLNDMNATERNKLFLAVVSPSTNTFLNATHPTLATLYQFSVGNSGLEFDKIPKTYSVIDCNMGTSCRDGFVEISELQISPNGTQLVLGYTIENDNYSVVNSNPNVLLNHTFDLFELNAAGATYERSIDLGQSAFTNRFGINSKVSSLDYSPNGSYIYFVEYLCGSCPYYPNSGISRIDLSNNDHYVFSSFSPSPGGSIRRGKDKRMYAVMAANGNNIIAINQPDNPSISAVTTTTLPIQTNSPAITILPIQPYTVFREGANPGRIQIARRELGKRSYEINDHLGNVRLVIGDRKIAVDQAPEYEYRYSFESDQDQPGPPTPGWSWTFSTDPNLVHSGKRSTGVTGHAHAFTMNVQPGDIISAEVMMKFTTGTRGGYLYTAYQDANGQNEVGAASHLHDLAAHEKINEWSRIYQPQTTVPAGKYKLIVYLRVSQSSGQSPSWFDDFKITIKRAQTEKVLIADVQSHQDYYAFGMQMPGRSYTGEGYRYGLNGQEKVDEVAPDHYTAPFWEYNAKLGRRWNQDPKPNPSISNYATFANNPILLIDPLGDTTWLYSESGKFIRRIDDSHGNQAHFVSSEAYNKANIEFYKKGGIDDIDGYAFSLRSSSTGFIGKNTMDDINSIFSLSQSEMQERGGLMQISETREIRLLDLSDEIDRSTNLLNGNDFSKAATENKNVRTLGIFHTHPESNPNAFVPSNMLGDDYQGRIGNADKTRGGYSALIISENHITIHQTMRVRWDQHSFKFVPVSPQEAVKSGKYSVIKKQSMR